MIVGSENLKYQPDLLQQVQAKAADAYIRRCIDDLAAECGDRAFAELFYAPSAIESYL